MQRLIGFSMAVVILTRHMLRSKKLSFKMVNRLTLKDTILKTIFFFVIKKPLGYDSKCLFYVFVSFLSVCFPLRSKIQLEPT